MRGSSPKHGNYGRSSGQHGSHCRRKVERFKAMEQGKKIELTNLIILAISHFSSEISKNIILSLECPQLSSFLLLSNCAPGESGEGAVGVLKAVNDCYPHIERLALDWEPRVSSLDSRCIVALTNRNSGTHLLLA